MLRVKNAVIASKKSKVKASIARKSGQIIRLTPYIPTERSYELSGCEDEPLNGIRGEIGFWRTAAGFACAARRHRYFASWKVLARPPRSKHPKLCRPSA